MRYFTVTLGQGGRAIANSAVLVDLRWAQGKPAGSGVYTRELAVALSRHLPVLGLVKPGPRPELPFEVAVLRDRPRGRFDLEQSVLARQTGAQLISISRVPALLAREQAMPVILDLSPLLFPQTHPRIRVLLERMTYPVAVRAGTIITLSRTSRRDLMERLSVSDQKICVVLPGAPAVIHEPADPKRLKELGILGDYVLAVGTLEPRKNLSLLVEIFAGQLRHLPLQLVFAGSLGWKYGALLRQMAPLQRTGRLVHVGYVSEGEKALLYRRAVCLAYPSLYEGFGLPILEAMTHGTPVVVSNAPACVEATGSAGIVLDPRDATAWADTLAHLVRDRAFRADLGQSGWDHSKQFSWQRSVIPLVQRLAATETAAAA